MKFYFAFASRSPKITAATTATAAVFTLLCGSVLPSARAIITAGETGSNFNAPTGELAAAGWQYAGYWHEFVGTPIAPNYFITAAHVGGQVGETFLFQGQSYTALARNYIEGTDVSVWQVDREFPLWASLFTGNTEVGRDMFTFGRSGPRGDAYYKDGYFRGWFGGDPALTATGPFGGQRLSWGTNIVDRTVDAFAADSWNPVVDGPHLSWGFDTSRGPNTGAIAGGDSGGGVFVRDDDGTWKLAGINFGYDGPYSPGAFPAGWTGAFSDARNMYLYNYDDKIQDYNYFYIDPAVYQNPVPTYSYASRLSVLLPQIQAISPTIAPQITSAPEPGAGALLAVGMAPLAGTILLRRCKKRTASRD